MQLFLQSGVLKADTRPNGDERVGDSGDFDLDSLRRGLHCYGN